MSDTTVKGLKELNDFLQALPVKIERNVLSGALRRGMNVVKPVAQANVHSISGQLAKGLKVGVNTKNGVVTASLKAKGPHAFVAKFVEYGTASHVIRAKVGGVLYFGGGYYKEVDHPGIKPKTKEFMRPALDTQANAAVIAAAEYMRERLATKEGLDTRDIDIGIES